MRKSFIIIAVLTALLSAGCMEQKESGASTGGSKVAGEGLSGGTASNIPSMVVDVVSPKAGAIYTGNKEVLFEASVSGGSAPYSYTWTSNLNGMIGSGQTLRLTADKLKKGEHTIIVMVADSKGTKVQGSETMRVL